MSTPTWTKNIVEAVNQLVPIDCGLETFRGFCIGAVAALTEPEFCSLRGVNTDDSNPDDDMSISLVEQIAPDNSQRVDLTGADEVQTIVHKDIWVEPASHPDYLFIRIHLEADGGPPSLWFIIKRDLNVQ